MATYQPTYQKGTDLNAGKPRDNKASCEAKGGIWDEATQTCNLLTKQVQGAANTEPTRVALTPQETIEGATKLPPQQRQGQVQDPQNPGFKPPAVPEVIKDTETGRATGVILPDGRIIFGIKPSEAQALAGNFAKDQALPEGTVAAGASRSAGERQVAIQQALDAAQQGIATPEQLAMVQGASPDVGQALGAGAIGAIPGLVGGAVAGAVGGATVGALGGPIGAVAGGVLGAAGGALTSFLSATRSNLASQQTEAFAADQEALRKGDRYLRSLITDTNKNPQNAPQNIALFYQTLNMIDAAHAKSYKDSQENLNRYLGKDGTEQLAKFDVFDSTMRTYYIQQFQTALAAPNPNLNLITAEDMNLE